MYNTVIGTTGGPLKNPIFQNPFTKTDRWYQYTSGGSPIPGVTSTITAQGLGTLWTTGQV
jgi:hypothetical protein